MRVLMTTDTLGGVWTYSLALAAAFRRGGVEVVLASMGAAPSAEQVLAASRLGNVTLVESDFALEWMEHPWDDVDAAGLWLQRLAERYEPDLVHLNQYAFGALDWRVPTLVVGHSCVLSWFEAVHGEPAPAAWDEYRERVTAGLRNADLVVAPTWAMQRSLQSFYGPLPRCQTIYNGCGASVEARLLPRSRASTATKRCEVFAAGRMWDAGKNVRLLVEAAERLPCTVRVASLPGPNGENESFPNVEFLGRLDSAQMAAAYGRAAVYALPARYEPFGYTPLEAARAGCALVLGDVPTLRELWEGAAMFVDPSDAAALVEVIEQVLGDEPLRRRLIANSVRRARAFTADRMASRYLAAFRRLLGETAATVTVPEPAGAL
jgi:glycogen synthase